MKLKKNKKAKSDSQIPDNIKALEKKPEALNLLIFTQKFQKIV